VKESWKSLNHSKATGPDDFDPHHMSDEHIDRFYHQIKDMINSQDFPEYIKVAKLLSLSKKSGAACIPSDTRGIQLLSFPFKVIEKVAYTKAMASGIFETGSY